jgi:hypothetical protein
MSRTPRQLVERGGYRLLRKYSFVRMIRNSLCNITTLLLGCQQATQVGAAEQAHHNAAALATYRAAGDASRTVRDAEWNFDDRSSATGA